MKAWNRWRADNPDIEPDLSGIDLQEKSYRPDRKVDSDFDSLYRDLNKPVKKKPGQIVIQQLIPLRVDLSGIDLSGVNLQKADLKGVIFNGANLDGADLQYAIFNRAQFIEASLRETNLFRVRGYGGSVEIGGFFNHADFSRADLSGAVLKDADLRSCRLTGANLDKINAGSLNLRGASLDGAHMVEARLVNANLAQARLREVNLSGATLAYTIFGNTDLSEAKGLDTCEHLTASILDSQTLLRSGPLPEPFLRGCGLSDLEIEFAKLYRKDLSASQVTDIGYRIIELRSDPAIQFHSCFISYSSKDDAFSRKLHNDLQDAGVRCWFAPEKMKIGDPFRDVIDDAVRLYDKLLLILSKHSIKSEWVKDEVEAALEKEQKRKQAVLFPIRIDVAIQRTRQAWASKLRRQRHIGDFRQWTDPEKYDVAFQRLLRDLREGK